MRGFLAWRSAPHRFDPISAGAIYPLIGVAGAGVLVYAILRTVIGADLITDAAAASAALLLLVVATSILVVVTDPVRTPVRFRGFAAAVVTVNLANIASAVGSWDSADLIWDRWGPIVVGVLILAFAEFRPGRDLAAATAVSALAVGVTSALEAPTSSIPASTTAAVIAATPVILFGAAGAVFSYRASLALSREAESAAKEVGGLTRRVRIRVRELLRETGRNALSVELVPFLTGILERDAVGEADILRARRMSAVLRSVIITDMGLPWLERMARANPGELVVRDEAGRGDELSMEQKVALRALTTAVLRLRASGEFGEPGDPVRLRVDAVGRHRSVLLRFPYDGTEAGARFRLGTFLTVMGSVFGRSTVTAEEGELRLLFAYEAEAG
ncbi:hypothetical protein [Herbiconiux solani]|uniref:hypothetical protein n=1 Tax=Herbiconiux solani TaxID=661329 RepID=UPI00082602D6|nr:hypothetical protein [Herbiconiux solani]